LSLRKDKAMNKKHLIIVLFVIMLFLVLLASNFLNNLPRKQQKQLSVATDLTEYSLGEFPVLTVKNDLSETVCFSECYRYYLEKGGEAWEGYLYGECKEPDLIKTCLAPEEKTNFELVIDLPEPECGPHRVALPVCLNCQTGEEFKENQRFYSNEFLIKQ